MTERADTKAQLISMGKTPDEAEALLNEHFNSLVEETGNLGRDRLRQVAQGATFAWGDEIEAGVRSLFGDETYDEEKAKIQGEINAYQTARPWESMAYEAGGGLLTGGAGGARAVAAAGLRKFAPGLLRAMTATSPVTRTGAAALTGAAEGAAYGTGAAEQGGDVISQGLLGAGTGALLNPIMSKIPDGIKAMVRKAEETTDDQASRAVGKLFRSDFDTPEEATSALRRMGPEGLPIHAGPTLAGGAKYAHGALGSRAKKRIEDTLMEGQKSQRGRVKTAYGQGTDPDAVNFYDEIARMNKARAATGRPLYDAAEASGLDHSQIDRLTDIFFATDRELPDQIKSIVYRANQEALFDKTTLGNVSPLKMFDYVKRGFNKEIDAAMDAGERSRLANLLRMKREMTDILDENEAYKKARHTWADDSEVITAAKVGRKLFAGDFDELQVLVRDMTETQREAFRVGAIRAMREKVDKAAMTTSDAKKLMRSKEIQDRLRMAFKSDAEYEDFAAKMSAEIDMTNTKNEILGGSSTARNLQAKEAIEGGLLDPKSLLDAGVMAADPLYMAVAALKKGMGKRKMTPEVVDAIAKKLLQQGMTPEEITRYMATEGADFASSEWQKRAGSAGNMVTQGLLQ